MIEYKLAVNKENLFAWGLKDIVDSMSISASVWLITDLEMTAFGNSDFHVGHLLDRIKTATKPGLLVSNTYFRSLVEDSDQVVDGEFIGFETREDARSYSRPLVRVDAFDSTEWTVIIDPDRVQVGETFLEWFGEGNEGVPFYSRSDC